MKRSPSPASQSFSGGIPVSSTSMPAMWFSGARARARSRAPCAHTSFGRRRRRQCGRARCSPSASCHCTAGSRPSVSTTSRTPDGPHAPPRRLRWRVRCTPRDDVGSTSPTHRDESCRREGRPPDRGGTTSTAGTHAHPHRAASSPPRARRASATPHGCMLSPRTRSS